jgi:hypothetical protein
MQGQKAAGVGPSRRTPADPKFLWARLSLIRPYASLPQPGGHGMRREQFDVVVAGCGVSVLERAPPEVRGGQSRYKEAQPPPAMLAQARAAAGLKDMQEDEFSGGTERGSGP